jgi:hypothetical protein
MRDSVMRIREIEVGIQRISINATIRATHIGTEGEPLNVIAAAMLSLASESNVNTETVAAALDAMAAATDDVSSRSLGTGEWMAEIRRAIAELHSSSESSSNRVNEIADLGTQLAADIGPVRSGFSAGRLFHQVVNRARCDLDLIAARSQSRAENVELDNLARRYTMQTQRDIHESVVRGVECVPATPVETPRATGADGDLGDNVELF